MTDTKHTPTPWMEANGLIYANGSVDTYSGSVIGVIAVAEDTSKCDSEGRIWSTAGCREANATHIVKCVNMHDELVEALKALHLQALQSSINDTSNNHGCEALDLAYAALKKAGAL